MGRDKTDKSTAWSNGVRAGMTGIVEAGLRITNNIHGRDIGPSIGIFVLGYWQCGPIQLRADLDDFLHRTGLDQLETARRLPQTKSKRLKIISRCNAERTGLRGAVLHQNIAQPETRLFDYVL